MNKIIVEQAIQQAYNVQTWDAIFIEYSQHVWRVEFQSTVVCVRLFIENCTEQFSREVEYLEWTSEQGWAPKIIAMDANHRWLITEWLPGQLIESCDYLNPQFIKKYLQQLRALHQSIPPKAIPCVPTLSRINDYLNCLPFPLVALKERSQQLAEQVHEQPLMMGLIHNDLHAGNAIVQFEQLKWIDWSESGFGDVGHDLAEVFLFFPKKQWPELLQLYLNRPASQAEIASLELNCQLRIALFAAWGFAKAYELNPELLNVTDNSKINGYTIDQLLHSTLSNKHPLLSAADYYHFATYMMDHLL